MSSRLKIIIVLISLALIGLVGIQFYWIDNAIDLKRDEFNQKVVRAMHNVVVKLERQETLEKLKRNQLGRQLIRQQMMRRKNFIDRKQKEAEFRRKHHPHDSTHWKGKWKITEEYSPDSSTRIIHREYVGSNDRSSVEIDVQMSNASRLILGDPIVNLNDSQLRPDHFAMRGSYLDEMLLELMDQDPFRRMEDRINYGLMDSLLRKELNDFMIETEYEFGVYNYFGQMLGDSPHADNPDLQQSHYRARLFPNDLLSEPFFLNLYFPNQKGFLLRSMWITLSVSAIFLLLIVGAFYYTIHVIQNQKQLSLIKNDFISNMTHELKTPISTISLACEALSDKDISADAEKKNRFLKMISQENKRLGLLVENVLKSSLWDRSDFRIKAEEVDVHDIVQEVAQSARIIVEQRDGILNLHPGAKEPIIFADRVHVTNILHNLIDNAIKYSDKKLQIDISTESGNHGVYIEVKDQGNGISKDQQRKIFDKFYRIPSGNVHNVKGFGLGLNYVKNVVENHGGSIEVKSSPGTGSTFTVFLPFKPTESK